MPLKIAAECVKGIMQRKLDWLAIALRDMILEFPSLIKERKPTCNRTACLYLRFQQEQGSLSWDLISWLRHKTQ